MLIWTAMCILMWLLGFSSIPLLIFAIVNKKASVAKGLIILGIYLPVFILAMFYASDLLEIYVPLGVVFFYFLAPFMLIIDVISIIINAVKMKKLDKTAKSRPFFIVFLSLLIVPPLFYSAVALRQFIILRNSDVVVKVYSGGNGGVGDSTDRVYAYDGKDIETLDLGASYGLEGFLSDDMKRSEDNEKAGSYNVELNSDDALEIYKDGQQVAKNETALYNNSIKEVYYK